jgi:hypothetical protein
MTAVALVSWQTGWLFVGTTLVALWANSFYLLNGWVADVDYVLVGRYE